MSIDPFSKKHVETGKFPYALYRLDMVSIVMAHLKYLSLDIFLRYFDHSKIIPCVSMESFTKNHVETGIFPYGFCIKMVRYWLDMVGIVMAHLNIFL